MRQALKFLLGLLAGALLASPAAAASEAAPRAQRVAPGVYVLPGILAEPDAKNAGRVVNTGFIVGRRGVVVIDSGANRRQGEVILAAIRQVTRRPVILLIDTHPHPQNVLGNIAFARRHIPILATAMTAEKMNERCPRCLEHLTASVGAEAMAGSEIVLPQQRITAATTIDLGDRRIRLIPTGWGHSEGDLVALDEPSGVLFTADLVYAGQIPHLSEARIDGWLKALDLLLTLPARQVVPGRGPLGTRQAIANFRRYIAALYTQVAADYRAGHTLDETLTRLDMPEFHDWQGYAERHPLNIQHVWYEIERNDFDATPSTSPRSASASAPVMG